MQLIYKETNRTKYKEKVKLDKITKETPNKKKT